MLSFEDNKNKFCEFLALRAIVTWGHLSLTKHKSVSKFQINNILNKKSKPNEMIKK